MSLNQLSDEIEVTERYDREDDVYYVTMKTAEPSIVRGESDDRFLLEVGIFTGLPTGFRILNYSKHKLAAEAFLPIFKKICIKRGLRKKDKPTEAAKDCERELEKAFAMAAG